jgi:hypothetical protein
LGAPDWRTRLLEVLAAFAEEMHERGAALPQAEPLGAA